MRAVELTIGRSFGVTLADGEDFFAQLEDFCRQRGIRSAYIPMFLGGFRSVSLVGSCEPIAHPEQPVWTSVEVQTVEALGSGTIAWDEEAERLAPHIHLAVGLKGRAAHGRTSHLLAGTVQFIAELLVVEVTDPVMTRPKVGPYQVPTLNFGPSSVQG